LIQSWKAILHSWPQPWFQQFRRQFIIYLRPYWCSRYQSDVIVQLGLSIPSSINCLQHSHVWGLFLNLGRIDLFPITIPLLSATCCENEGIDVNRRDSDIFLKSY
jgi:hypothetical protein